MGPQSFVKITIVLDLHKDHINHYNSLVLFWNRIYMDAPL